MSQPLSEPRPNEPLPAPLPQLGMGPAQEEPDSVRNRRLRRADWRFLLPTPSPARSVCFTRGDLAEATTAISGTCFLDDGSGASPEGCDLAVRVDPSPGTLSRAWASLQPGGSCYVEWHAKLAGGPSRVRRRLESAGFELVSCYAPRPNPARRGAEVWVPLGSDSAARYFVSGQSQRVKGLRRLLRQARGVVWGLGEALRFAVPVCTTARKPWGVRKPSGFREPRPGAGISTELLDTLLSNWGHWGLGSVPHLSALLVTRGRRSINKAVTLVFAGSEGTPRLAIKRGRVPESNAPMQNEADVLRAIQARPGGVVGAPRVLFCRELDGFLTLAETTIEGRILGDIIRPENHRALALRATEWSAGLAEGTPPAPRDVWWGRLVEPVLARFERTFGSVIDPGAFRAAAQRIESLGALPLVCEQRDFSPWNLLIDAAGTLGVLDGESAELQGLPVLDLVYWLTYLTSNVDGSGQLWESLRSSLDPGCPAGRITQECLELYLERVAVPACALPPLRLLTWMIHSKSDYRHFCLDLGRAPDPAMLRRSVFLRLWNEEVRSSSPRSRRTD
jgi:hypothetical protein